MTMVQRSSELLQSTLRQISADCLPHQLYVYRHSIAPQTVLSFLKKFLGGTNVVVEISPLRAEAIRMN